MFPGLRALRLAIVGAAITGFGCGAATAAGEDFPSQAVRIVVPFPPGGSSDAIARMLAEGMTAALGERVYVDNRPGAASNIGAEQVAKARPDGHTLLFGGSVIIVNSLFGPRPSFDPREAFVPVTTVAEVPFLLATRPDAPFRTPRDFVNAARARPGHYTIASGQLDTYIEKFKQAAEADVLHVPYKGGAQAVNDVMAGQVDVAFALAPVLLPLIQTGKLHALGISSTHRLLPTLPQVPTLKESGVNFVLTVWYGLLAPTGIPDERLQRLNAAARKAVEMPTFRLRLAEIGARASASTPEGMENLLARQRELWEVLAAERPEMVQSKP